MAGDQFSLADGAGFTIIRAYQKSLDWRPDRPLAVQAVGYQPSGWRSS
jgi:hypothetical protein